MLTILRLKNFAVPFGFFFVSTLYIGVLIFTIATFFYNNYETNQVYNISCERKRSEWRPDLE